MLDSGIRHPYRVAMRITPKHTLPAAALPSAAPSESPQTPGLAVLRLAPVLVSLSAMTPQAALGQAESVIRPEAIAESVLRPYSVRQMRDAPIITLPEPTEAETVDDGRAPRDYVLMNGGVQVIEQPRDPVTGAYRRPKIIVGLPSDAMKGWLKAGGITAERCLLPMVRARARLSEDGEASGTLWLYARCTFQ